MSEASVAACCFSPCGQFFVTGCSRGDLKLWDVDIGLLHNEKDAHDLGVTCCSFANQFTVGESDKHFRATGLNLTNRAASVSDGLRYSMYLN